MILSYDELCALVESGCITNVDKKAINGSSIDITLGRTLLLEANNIRYVNVISLRDKEPLYSEQLIMTDAGYTMSPDEFLLAHSEQSFTLPEDITATFYMKSTPARMGLTHALATHCDPGWHNSVLTLELKNQTRYHHIHIRPGDYIGQMVFHRHAKVPHMQSYAVRGHYNMDDSVQGAKQ